VERLHPVPNVTLTATSGLDNIINIARARQLGLFGLVARFSRDVPTSSVQHPLYLLRFRKWISSWPFLEALKWTT